MKLSTRGDYAVRVVLVLAEAGGHRTVPTHELAGRAGVPARYLAHLLRELQTRGIVAAVRGATGGFSLGRPADQITVGEVVRVMDGPLAPIACASLTAHVPCPTVRCQSEEDCVLRDLWLDVRAAISGIVDHTTFADLAARRRISRAAPSTYSI